MALFVLQPPWDLASSISYLSLLIILVFQSSHLLENFIPSPIHWNDLSLCFTWKWVCICLCFVFLPIFVSHFCCWRISICY
jgi:ABC-type molybdate transport system permease subunit